MIWIKGDIVMDQSVLELKQWLLAELDRKWTPGVAGQKRPSWDGGGRRTKTDEVRPTSPDEH